MNLNSMSSTVRNATGEEVGFVIKSVARPERRFRVCFKFPSGQYGITRIDSGVKTDAKKDFIVSGAEDRYDFVVPMGRIKQVYEERAELLDQKSTIDDRISELDAIIEGSGATDLDETGTDGLV